MCNEGNKMKTIQKFKYPKDVDEELIPMLNIINSIPGVRTLFSCCGHGKNEFYLALAYTSCQTRSYIDNIFQRISFNIKGFNDEDTNNKNICKFRILDMYCLDNNDMIFENRVLYSSNELGLMNKKERLKEYKKICYFLMKLLPNEYWDGNSKKYIGKNIKI
jgi:hypothetical protein